MCYYTYKAIYFNQPPYLSSIIKQSNLTRGNCLSIFSSKPNKHSVLRRFIVVAPTELNSSLKQLELWKVSLDLENNINIQVNFIRISTWELNIVDT